MESLHALKNEIETSIDYLTVSPAFVEKTNEVRIRATVPHLKAALTFINDLENSLLAISDNEMLDIVPGVNPDGSVSTMSMRQTMARELVQTRTQNEPTVEFKCAWGHRWFMPAIWIDDELADEPRYCPVCGTSTLLNDQEEN